MAGVLEIKNDPVEQQAAAAAAPTEISLQDLPDYLVEDEGSKTPIALSIIAVVFFLLCTAGVAAGTQYYLIPQRAEAEDALASLQASTGTLESQIRKEEKRGEEHLQKLQKVQASLTAAEQSRVATVTREAERIAQTVAKSRELEGGYVMIQSVAATADEKITLSGSVDSYLTFADWTAELEASPLFQGIVFTGAAQTGEAGSTTVPFSLNFKLEPFKALPPQKEAGAVPPGGVEPPSAAPAPVSSFPSLVPAPAAAVDPGAAALPVSAAPAPASVTPVAPGDLTLAPAAATDPVTPPAADATTAPVTVPTVAPDAPQPVPSDVVPPAPGAVAPSPDTLPQSLPPSPTPDA